MNNVYDKTIERLDCLINELESYYGSMRSELHDIRVVVEQMKEKEEKNNVEEEETFEFGDVVNVYDRESGACAGEYFRFVCISASMTTYILMNPNNSEVDYYNANFYKLKKVKEK